MVFLLLKGVIFAKQREVATEEQLKAIANCVNLMGCEQSPLTLTRFIFILPL